MFYHGAPQKLHCTIFGPGDARVRPELSGELQSPGSGPFFGANESNSREIVGRKHGPDPFALDFAVLLKELFVYFAQYRSGHHASWRRRAN